MSPHEESAFMTNREMIRDMYARTKSTEKMVGNMKGDLSVLKSVQGNHKEEINNLKAWRNINVTASGLLTALLAAIGLHK